MDRLHFGHLYLALLALGGRNYRTCLRLEEVGSENPAFLQLPYDPAYWHEMGNSRRSSLPLLCLPMLVGDEAPSPLAGTNPGWKQVSARLRRKNNLHGAENSPASWVFQPRGHVPKNRLEPL